VPWYYRVLSAINVAFPFLAPTQATNLALLVSAVLNPERSRYPRYGGCVLPLSGVLGVNSARLPTGIARFRKLKI
jgi:hypothetical protein